MSSDISNPITLNILKAISEKGLDAAFLIVGEKNFYQMRLLVCLCIHWIFASFIFMFQPFLNQQPIFICTNPDGTTYDCTENNGGCNSQVISPNSPDSLVVDFGLYCDKAYLRSLGGTIFFFGGSLGSIILLSIADKTGRKPVLMLSYAFGVIGIILLGFSNGVATYFVFISLSWFGFDPYFALSTIFANEGGGEIMRKISSSVLFMTWATGEMMLVGFAYLIPDWRYVLIFVIGIPMCLMSLLFFFIYESPRFFASQNNHLEAAKILYKISLANKKSIALSDDQPISELVYNENEKANLTVSHDNISQNLIQETPETKKIPFLLLFKSHEMRKRIILMSLLFLYIYIVYNGIAFGIQNLGGNIYINSLISAFSELIGYIASEKVISNVSRKKTLYLFIPIATFFALLFLPFQYLNCESFICNPDVYTPIFTLVVKFCISIVFVMIYVYASEIFPTDLRSSGVGFTIFIGRFGSMAVTFIIQLSAYVGLSQMVFYGIFGLLILIPIWWLPETHGITLSDHMNEISLN